MPETPGEIVTLAEKYCKKGSKMHIVSIPEWWVQHGSTWEPLLEPGQVEAEMTAEELRIIESTKDSRMNDARKCRLAAFGAALRNRNYDKENGFNTEALERALRALLHTQSLVGPDSGQTYITRSG